MLRARVTLQNMKTLTYNFPDEDIQLAVEFPQKLDELYQYFYSRLRNEKGLIILTQIQESLRSTKRREHIHKNTDYANLPPRKKLKKSSEKRYGIKADRARKESKVRYSYTMVVHDISARSIIYTHTLIENHHGDMIQVLMHICTHAVS